MSGCCLGSDGEHRARYTRLRIFVAVHDLAGCCCDRKERSGPVAMRNQIEIACSGSDFEVSLIARLWCCSYRTVGCYRCRMTWIDDQGTKDKIFGQLPDVCMQAWCLRHCTRSMQAVAVAVC